MKVLLILTIIVCVMDYGIAALILLTLWDYIADHPGTIVTLLTSLVNGTCVLILVSFWHIMIRR